VLALSVCVCFFFLVAVHQDVVGLEDLNEETAENSLEFLLGDGNLACDNHVIVPR